MGCCSADPITLTLTGSQTGIGSGNASVIRCNNASLLTIHGIGAGFPGQQVILTSVGAGQVDIANQSGTEPIPANRIANGVTGTISLAAGVGRAVLEYDDVSAVWRVIQHEQGAWITPTFNAGDYTANGSMTWTVSAVTTARYWLKGRTLTFALHVFNSTIGGTLNTQLRRIIPGGFTPAAVQNFYLRVQDAGVFNSAFAEVQPSVTNILFLADPIGGTNWTAGTNNCGVSGTFSFEVQ